MPETVLQQEFPFDSVAFFGKRGARIALHASPIHGTEANGPGIRSVVWVQGCMLNCPGCHNPKTHVLAGGFDQSCRELALELALQAVHGVTWTGGEPVHQLPAVVEVMKEVGRLRHPALRVGWGMFTGYTECELESGQFRVVLDGAVVDVDPVRKRSLWQEAKKYLDFVVAGRFDQNMLIRSGLLASSNQSLLVYTKEGEKAYDCLSLDEVLIDGKSVIRTGFGPGWLRLGNSPK